MRLNHKQIFNLPVYTSRGDFLGKVVDFQLQTETHCLVKYFVAQSKLVRDLLKMGETLEIAAHQVISITNKKMIVEDNVMKEKNAEQEKIRQSASAVPVSLSRLSDQ